MFLTVLQDHLDAFGRLSTIAGAIERIGQLLAQGISNGRKILLCGNGGSAADAQHFAAELIGRFEQERPAWPAVALTTDSSILTAVGNDYGFADLFARQVQGLGCRGDILIGISTSGNSENVLRAASMAGSLGVMTIGLLGRDGGAIKSAVDHALVVSEMNTARVQEAHIFILHFWAMLIEQQMTSAS